MKTYQSPLFHYAILSLGCCFSFLVQRILFTEMNGQEIFCAIAFGTLILVSVILFFLDAEIRKLEIGRFEKWFCQMGIVGLSLVFFVRLVLPVI